MKQKKPRKREHDRSFDLVIREGNTPIVKIKEKRFKNINEVLEELNRKL